MNKIIHGPNVAGQSLADRMMAAKHTITGQDLAKAVFKATTDEVMGPKRKHLDCKATPILHDFNSFVRERTYVLLVTHVVSTTAVRVICLSMGILQTIEG